MVPRPIAATVLGAALVVALSALDLYWDQERLISATVVIGPFLAALAAGPRLTAAVGAVAVAAALLSGAWNDNFGEDAYFLRLIVVAAGSWFAVAAARIRRRLAVDQQRFALLRGAAQIADETRTVPDVIERVRELLVPALAETCTIDLERTERRTDTSRTIVVPLRSQGRVLGTMELGGRRFTPEDREFAVVLGGRVALALENAGLQARLTTALGALAEAVTIQDERGGLVYANDAAAAALGFASAEELLATPPREIVDAYASFNEDGTPLRLDQLPARRLLGGETADPLLVRAVNKTSGEERWRVVKATLVEGPPRLAVNVIEDVTDVKRAELAQRFLAEAGAVLASSLDYEDTLARITQLAVPRLADWCAVSLPAGDRLRTVAVAHVDPAKVRFAREYEERHPTRLNTPSGAAQVLAEGRSQVVNGITDELLDQSVEDAEQREALRGLGMRAVMLVPMVSAGRAIGVITFVSAESRRTFAAADLELAEELGRRAGTAVEHARLYRERSRIAATLQRGLLPDALPEIPGLRLSSLYRPAGEENLAGGDFYDAFPTATGWMLLVGDVTGRGAEAAAETGQARHTLRTAGTLLSDPAAALEQLNRALADRRELTPCTVAIVHVTARTAQVLSAGHPRPLLVRAGTVRAVGRSGPLVGVWLDSRWSAELVSLEPGDVIVLYTDGVTDARGERGRFGDARLLDALRGATDARGAVAAIDRALDRFQRGPQADDTAVLALDIPPAAA